MEETNYQQIWTKHTGPTPKLDDVIKTLNYVIGCHSIKRLEKRVCVNCYSAFPRLSCHDCTSQTLSMAHVGNLRRQLNTC